MSGRADGEKRNYQQELDRILEQQNGTHPRLLLHSCCGPCSSAVLEYLTQYFAVSVFWYNPNIYPQAEFDRRLQAQEKLPGTGRRKVWNGNRKAARAAQSVSACVCGKLRNMPRKRVMSGSAVL